MKILDELTKAYVHPSKKNKNRKDNQRLEFLGDSVIGLIVSEYLFRNFPHDQEGKMSQSLGRMVSTENLAKYAKILKLNERLHTSSRVNSKALAEVFEAVVGEIYIKYGLDTVQSFMQETGLLEDNDIILDSKTKLVHIANRNNLDIDYEIISEDGPAHDKVFEMACTVYDPTDDMNYIETGKGKTKKEAEFVASDRMLDNPSFSRSFIDATNG